MAQSQTSLTLLQRARSQDADAWRRVVDLYRPLVVHWSRQLGVGATDVDDVVQDVFHAVSRGLADFRRDRPGDTFRGWLRGITRFKVLDHFRQRGQFPTAAGGTDAQRQLLHIPDPLGTDDDPPEQLSSLYHRALELVRSEFEERTWQAFWRAAVDGHLVAEIARDLGISPAGVRQAKSRILRRLREEVGDVID